MSSLALAVDLVLINSVQFFAFSKLLVVKRRRSAVHEAVDVAAACVFYSLTVCYQVACIRDVVAS